jgi:DNA-binding transcriptional MerR regulator
MFQIGNFSRLSQVTVKALRHYDEIGLFKPARVDPFSGYRYYSTNQLPHLNRILALKDLGLSLEQIKDLMAEDVPLDQLRGMLRMKQTELQGLIDDEQERLDRVAARLRQIEREGTMPEYEVVKKKIKKMKAATLRGILPAYSHVPEQIGKVFAYIGQNRGFPVGPPMSLYHDHEYREQDVDVETVVPVKGPIKDGEEIVIRELPAIEAAVLIHEGDVADISQAYEAAGHWIEANGYQIAGPVRERYLSEGPPDDSSQMVIEIQLPITPA